MSSEAAQGSGQPVPPGPLNTKLYLARCPQQGLTRGIATSSRWLQGGFALCPEAAPPRSPLQPPLLFSSAG